MQCMDCNRILTEENTPSIFSLQIYDHDDEELVAQCDVGICNHCLEIKYYLSKYRGGATAPS